MVTKNMNCLAQFRLEMFDFWNISRARILSFFTDSKDFLRFLISSLNQIKISYKSFVKIISIEWTRVNLLTIVALMKLVSHSILVFLHQLLFCHPTVCFLCNFFCGSGLTDKSFWCIIQLRFWPRALMKLTSLLFIIFRYVIK